MHKPNCHTTYLITLELASHRIGPLDDTIDHSADMLSEGHVDIRRMPTAHEPGSNFVPPVKRQLLLEIELGRLEPYELR